MKPRPTFPPQPQVLQGHSPFLDMIRSKRGFPVATQPPKDMEVQGEEVSRKEDDTASAKTQESSMEDAEVIFSILNCQQHIHLFIQDPFTLHNLG